MVSKKLRRFGTTIFSEMTRLAIEHSAINLSQGFPDFDGPPFMVDAAAAAMRSGQNQYARSLGHPELVSAVAAHVERRSGMAYDPTTEVGVYSGCTEGLMAAVLGLLDPGDEVVYFEPFYDSYPACVAMAGAVARPCPLRFPDFAVDLDRLGELLGGSRTRLLLLNTPHNPTGKVFDRTELEAIAALCQAHDVVVVADEVYEQLVYDGARHISMAEIPGMRERTLALSSAGKTFSFTGWKVGWGTGPAPMVAAAQAAHQFMTFATATPLQVAVADALERCDDVFNDQLRAEYTERRDFLVETLRGVGLRVAVPEGKYFVLADFTALWPGDDVSFVRHLVQAHGVAAVPPSVFYEADPEEGRRLVRFAFCKRMETLKAAADRLQGLGR